jgi:hypothetical protein
MMTDFPGRAAYEVAKARHRVRTLRSRGAPFVVFSMAKSGSSAIAAALREAGAAPVFQVHDLDPDFLDEEEQEYHWAGRPWRNWDAQCLLTRPHTVAQPWRVVSLVRDPIAQRVSAFFQPGTRLGYLGPNATVESLLGHFSDGLKHLELGWFESHIEAELGIDVYGTEFDAEKGYQILRTPSVSLLLLRCEGLDVAPVALAELLGRAQPVEVPRVNVSADKDYGQLYKAFARALAPPQSVIDRAMSSRMVRHFYTEAEIATFRDKWSSRDLAAKATS